MDQMNTSGKYKFIFWIQTLKKMCKKNKIKNKKKKKKNKNKKNK